MVLVQPKEWRRTLALYAAVRAVQCWYNSQREKGHWHFWGSDWDYGDAALFAICSAQVFKASLFQFFVLPLTCLYMRPCSGNVCDVGVRARVCVGARGAGVLICFQVLLGEGGPEVVSSRVSTHNRAVDWEK
jgi:hypothetical protein